MRKNEQITCHCETLSLAMTRGVKRLKGSPDAPHIAAAVLGAVAVLKPISKILDPCVICIVLSGGPVVSGTESTDGGSVCVDCV